MLALVKKHHTEISINGEAAEAILRLIGTKFPIEIISANSEDKDSADFFQSDYWSENKFRLLAGARLKHNMTQEELAEKSGIKQSVISQYESGKRKISMRAAVKLGKALGEKPEMLIPL